MRGLIRGGEGMGEVWFLRTCGVRCTFVCWSDVVRRIVMGVTCHGLTPCGVLLAVVGKSETGVWKRRRALFRPPMQAKAAVAPFLELCQRWA